jgi:hypothetical protein
MDEIFIFFKWWNFLNDGPTIKTCNIDHKAGSQHKRKMQKNNNAKSPTNQNN